MKNRFSTLKQLTKTEQQNIKGGGRCDGYNGPFVVTCAEYYNLPPQFRICVVAYC